MTDIKQNHIQYYKKALLLSNRNNDFENFLNSLTDKETEVYLYIEAKKIESFLNEFGINSSGIHSKTKEHNIINSNKDYSFIIEFCKNCSGITKPSIEIRENIISKHREFIMELTKEETDFFLEC